MPGTHRIEIREKGPSADALERNLMLDIKDIGVSGIESVKVVRVYSFEGVSDRDALRDLASEVLTDAITQEFSMGGPDRSLDDDARVVEIAYNEGVTDPVEQSVRKAAGDSGLELGAVATSTKYVLRGKLSSADMDKVAEKLLYNRTVQHIVSGPGSAGKDVNYGFRDDRIRLTGVPDEELARISSEGHLYLDLTEMRAIKEYFDRRGRDPSRCELETLAQTWSEHCKHKTMRGRIEFNGQVIDDLLDGTIMRATRELDREWCVSVFKDNAGVIRFDDEYDITFKVETHNHPSALEPYGGAETGMGGVIRDTLGTGLGARPIMSTDVFCLGYPDMPMESVPKGSLHPKRVLKGVVAGVRDYGNKMGIPTVNGAICFDEGFLGNPLVFCGNVGIIPKGLSVKKASPGDLIVVTGGRTGRDGIHGATFSSGQLCCSSEETFSTAVQIGDPITQKKMADTLLAARDAGLYESVTDCGAGGLSSAVGEMAEKTGCEVHLERVPLKYRSLAPWEIWVSEAQERMVLAVRPDKLDKLLEIFAGEDVMATVIGEFTDTGRLRLLYDGNEVADLEMSFLHDGVPRPLSKAVWEERERMPESMPEGGKSLETELVRVLGSWNVASKEWVIRQYDHEVQGGSVLKPLTGPRDDGPSDAGVSRPLLDRLSGVVLGCGICPDLGLVDPYWMAASAMEEALRQVVAVGGSLERTAVLDNFCWGDTADPYQLGALVRAAQACYDMAKAFGVPFISGKDSLNNSFDTARGRVSIPPTLLISAISVTDDVSRGISMDVKSAGNALFVLGTTYREMAASQYFKINGFSGGEVPRVRVSLAVEILRVLEEAIQCGLVISAHDCSEGGLGVSLAEMLFGGGLGAELTLQNVPRDEGVSSDEVALFAESNSRFVVEVPADKEDGFRRKAAHVAHGFLGRVKDDGIFALRSLEGKVLFRADIEVLRESWKRPFRELMHEDC